MPGRREGADGANAPPENFNNLDFKYKK